MKIDFSTIILDAKDNPVMGQDSDGASIPLTLATVATTALFRMDAKDDGAIKFKVYQLAMKIGNGGEHAIEPKDAELLKQRIGMSWAPLVVGRAWDILNGDMAPKEKVNA